MARRLTLVLGGARSGKSTYAQNLAGRENGPVLYVATAEALDEEMAARILAHRRQRPPNWSLLEQTSCVGLAISERLRRQPAPVVLLDCLTMLVSNILSVSPQEAVLAGTGALNVEIDQLLHSYEDSQAHWIIVSSEVGMGIVPPYPLGRVYRDALGSINQRIAARADAVILLVAGMPLQLKG
jgi:adenosylcobinamide kinase/adenosylcobinamide-phosphate guanylyltransferase